jgi:hypothetical protein
LQLKNDAVLCALCPVYRAKDNRHWQRMDLDSVISAANTVNSKENIMFGLNHERSIWVEQEDLGKAIVIKHNKKRYEVKIPPKIRTKVTIRLEGLGKTKDKQTGDLLLNVWLNKGDDIQKQLWLSETCARIGACKKLSFEEKRIEILIPPNSQNGVNIRLKGLGRASSFRWRAPFLRRKRGNLLVKLCVYPDHVSPKYGSFATLTTDDMAMEGWVYQMKDEIKKRMGADSFVLDPINADAVADLFNECGWTGIFYRLVRYLKLDKLDIKVEQSDSICKPGSCVKLTTMQNNIPVNSNYVVTIKDQFLDNPFFVAAILAHELCHVIYSERIDSPRGFSFNKKGIELDSSEERTVDLLVFLFKLGEFQLRVAREKGIILGYFNQDIFERMQIIASKK